MTASFLTTALSGNSRGIVGWISTFGTEVGVITSMETVIRDRPSPRNSAQFVPMFGALQLSPFDCACVSEIYFYRPKIIAGTSGNSAMLAGIRIRIPADKICYAEL